MLYLPNCYLRKINITFEHITTSSRNILHKYFIREPNIIVSSSKVTIKNQLLLFNINMDRNTARPLKCTYCFRRFKYTASLKDHIRTDHSAILLATHQAGDRIKYLFSEPVKITFLIRVSFREIFFDLEFFSFLSDFG
jgi:hypothetical protein